MIVVLTMMGLPLAFALSALLGFLFDPDRWLPLAFLIAVPVGLIAGIFIQMVLS